MSDIKFVAKKLIAEGWALARVPAGSKEATQRWNKPPYAAVKHFKDGDNVAGLCGEPSNWRVDVDCDAPEAVDAARLLLPDTGLIHGRPGKPSSHFWYSCEGAKSKPFKDEGGNMLLEIRSTGMYTVIPPSVHGSGDVLAWESERPPTIIAPDALHDAVRNVAVAALLARHWPANGPLTPQHDCAGYAAGFLLQAKVPDFLVIEIIKAAATIAGDSDVKDRVLFARSTVDKFKNDVPVTGGPKLAEVLGKDVVDRMRGWLQLADTDALDELNAIHFVTRLGRETVIGREDDPDSIVFQKPHDLYTAYANRFAVSLNKTGDTVMKPLFEEWLHSRSRREFSKVVFAPPPLKAREAEAGKLAEYNLWKGFAVQPDPAAWKDGKCLPMLNHIREIICDGDPASFNYLLNLLAHTIQYPGEPLGICVVMRGRQGTGKGVFVQFVGALFHRHHFAHLTKMEQALGKFNKAIMGKIIVFLDEAAADAAMKNLGTFKSLITEKWIQIEPKGLDSDSVRNLGHTFVSTNEGQSIPTDDDDRRDFFLKVSDRYASNGSCSKAEQLAYFERLHLHDPLTAGDKEALGAFLYFLQSRPLDAHHGEPAFNRFDKVVTTEERHQRQLSLRGTMRWLYYLDALGEMPFPPGTEVSVASMYRFYEAHAKQHDEIPVSPGPWGKVAAPFLWVNGTKHTNKGNVGELVTVEELHKRLRPLTDFKAEEITEYRKPKVGPVYEVKRILTDEEPAVTTVKAEDDDLPF